MMKLCLLVFVTLFAVTLALPKPNPKPDDAYTNKYDNVDIDQILQSERLLRNYVNCLLDKGKCTPEGTELKSVINDALETECSKCNDKQKDASKKVLKFLLKNKREYFDELEAKYDPDHKYRTKYADEIQKEGITL